MNKSKDRAITLMQLLCNATGAEFEDENLAVDIIAENLEDYTRESKFNIDLIRLSFTSIDEAVNDLNLNKRVKWFVWNGELVRKGHMCPEPVIVNGTPVLINEA